MLIFGHLFFWPSISNLANRLYRRHTCSAFCQGRFLHPLWVQKNSLPLTLFTFRHVHRTLDIWHFEFTALRCKDYHCVHSVIFRLTLGHDRAWYSTHCFWICACVLIRDEYLPGTLHEYWVHLITSVCQGSRGSNIYPHSLSEHKRVLAASGEDALADLEVDASAPLQVVAELWSSKRWAPG